MDHIRILRRALEITRSYRALWIFGILLALTTTRTPGNNSSWQENGGDGGIPTPRDWDPRFPDIQLPPEVGNVLVGLGITLACLLVLLGIAFVILRYVSLTASIRMVDRFETSGEKLSSGAGFRLGWSRASFRLWLVDLVVWGGWLIGLLLALLVAAAPLLLLLTQNEIASVIGGIAAAALAVLVLFFFIVAAIALNLLVELFYRAVVIENLGVFDAVRRGIAVARRRVGDTIIMGLMLFGLSLAALVVFVPLFLVLLVAGVVAGGLPALLAGAITNIFVHGSTPQIVAGLVGAPIFLAVLFIPLLLASGLVETFFSTTWTLAYRELSALASGIKTGEAY